MPKTKPTPRPTVTVRVCEPELRARRPALVAHAVPADSRSRRRATRTRACTTCAAASPTLTRSPKSSRRGTSGWCCRRCRRRPTRLQQRAEGFRQARMRGLALWAERVARVPTLLLDVLTAASSKAAAGRRAVGRRAARRAVAVGAGQPGPAAVAPLARGDRAAALRRCSRPRRSARRTSCASPPTRCSPSSAPPRRR